MQVVGIRTVQLDGHSSFVSEIQDSSILVIGVMNRPPRLSIRNSSRNWTFSFISRLPCNDPTPSSHSFSVTLFVLFTFELFSTGRDFSTVVRGYVPVVICVSVLLLK
jgi:hypothetical protein